MSTQLHRPQHYTAHTVRAQHWLQLGIVVASFPVLPRTRFTFTCDNCGGEHFETGKAWSETSREVDVVLYIIVQVPLPPGVYLPVLYYIYSTTSTSRDVSDQAFPVSKCSPPQLSHVNVNRVRGRTGNEARIVGTNDMPNME